MNYIDLEDHMLFRIIITLYFIYKYILIYEISYHYHLYLLNRKSIILMVIINNSPIFEFWNLYLQYHFKNIILIKE